MEKKSDNTVKHGRSKFISNYGGVGSIIETTECSIIIESFDNWQYPKYNDKAIKSYIVQDDRLLDRLRTRFPKLRQLVNIPTEEINGNVQPQANHFPKWFYCTKCNRLRDYRTWKGKNNDFDLKCNYDGCNKTPLEQIRFILVCQKGHVQDLPWKYWNSRVELDDKAEIPKESGTIDIVDDNDIENDKKEKRILIKYEPCCDNQDLRYVISRENSELSGISIMCENCKNRGTLKGLFNYSQKCSGRKYWLGLQGEKGFVGEECDCKTKLEIGVRIKSSNSVYYSNTLSSIWIPEKQIVGLSLDMRIEIDSIKSDEEYEYKDLEKFAKRNNISIELINQYLQDPESNNIPENLFRQTEYNYFLKNEQPESKEIKFRLINCNVQINGFENLIKIDKIKKITVQTSFTRREPIDIDSVLEQDGKYQYKVARQSVSKNSFETRLLPAIESYGEGILFILDKQKLQNWEINNVVIDRIETLKINAQNSEWQSHKIEASKLTPRRVLIHTLSHLFIRELEYVCGYPASSLQERLYVSENMYGFLISAYDGTDGYLGGLSNLCNDLDNLQKIINSALERAKDCSLDPICFESDGQGIAQLNFAACHSCALLPETSCELSNLFLDRQLVVNSSFAYFRNM
jgi:Domain of unknown function (DUF1998)